MDDSFDEFGFIEVGHRAIQFVEQILIPIPESLRRVLDQNEINVAMARNIAARKGSKDDCFGIVIAFQGRRYAIAHIGHLHRASLERNCRQAFQRAIRRINRNANGL